MSPQLCPFCFGENPDCLKCFGETLLSEEEAQTVATEHQGQVSCVNGIYGVICCHVHLYEDGEAIKSISVILSHEELNELKKGIANREFFTFENWERSEEAVRINNHPNRQN